MANDQPLTPSGGSDDWKRAESKPLDLPHTPGPWATEAVSDAVRIIARIPSRDGMSRRPGGVKVILARANPRQLPEAETHANARLMAAAPELLGALKECLLLFARDHALDRMDWGKSALRAEDIRELNELPLKVRVAIAKAEDRS